MKSVFFRRLLIVMVMVMMLTTIAMALGCGVVGIKIYENITLEEMVPKAGTVADLVRELGYGHISREAFLRIAQSYVEASDSTTLVFSKDKEIILAANMPNGDNEQEVYSTLSDTMDKIISGDTVKSESLAIKGIGDTLSAGVPITDDSGNIYGGVLIFQPVRIVSENMRPMRVLIYTALLAGVLIMLLLMSWRFSLYTDPLHKMSEVAIEMSKGNFDIRANENEDGEIGLLARALNTLCENISGTIYQLRMEKGQLDQVLQSLSDGVAAIDGSGELTHYNAALMRMFGVVNVEKTEDLIKDPMVWKTFQEVFHTGESQVITYPMSGDKVLWISVSPVNTDEGVRTGVVGLFKDMTEMERTERMRREYVANISHELRTPLTAVRGLLEPLADGMVKSEEDKQRYYKIMLHEVMRLSRLITDMLTLSRLQAGTEYMELSRVNLEELINDVAMGYASTAQSKGIKLDVDCDHTVDGLTDPDRIEQVLVILIDNAMRYTPEGGSIKIKLRSGERLIISVQDNGCGIPEKDLPHIFERFYKVDKSRGEGGTGLGLSIAKYIMEKLDENITVASELGKGTIFTFTVKKYVSNAIELGPAKESRYEKDRDKKEKPAEKAPDEDGVYDADYEIVHCPPEEKEKKLKFPEVKIKKRKEPKEAGEQKKSGDQKERQ